MASSSTQPVDVNESEVVRVETAQPSPQNEPKETPFVIRLATYIPA
jgi:hypothetical protein